MTHMTGMSDTHGDSPAVTLGMDIWDKFGLVGYSLTTGHLTNLDMTGHPSALIGIFYPQNCLIHFDNSISIYR